MFKTLNVSLKSCIHGDVKTIEVNLKVKITYQITSVNSPLV